MKHKTIRVFALQCINTLLITRSAQRGNHQRLGFTASKQSGAMSTRQNAISDRDRTHGTGIAAINARLAIEYLVANDPRFEITELGFYVVNKYRIGVCLDQH